MCEPPPSSFQHAFHAALEGEWGCLPRLAQEESLLPTSLPIGNLGFPPWPSEIMATCSQSPPWTAPAVRLELPRVGICRLFNLTPSVSVLPPSPQNEPVPFCNRCLRHCSKEDMVIYYWSNGRFYERNSQLIPIFTVRHTLILSLELSFC